MKKVLVSLLGLSMVAFCLVVSISCVTPQAGPTFPTALQSAFPTYTPCGYPGATCTATPQPALCIATPISMGTTVTGDTTLDINKIRMSCSSSSSTAPDHVYVFSLGAPTTVTISTCSANTNFDTVIGFLSNCSPSNVVACNDFDGSCGAGVNPSVLTRSLAPGTYWVVVDGWTTSSYGTYDLSIQPF